MDPMVLATALREYRNRVLSEPTLQRLLETPSYPGLDDTKMIAPGVICNDGTYISVQAGSGNYCTPRNNVGPWTHVEIGYPRAPVPDRWLEYAEEPNAPEETIYAYIPILEAYFYIGCHGGMNVEATLNEFERVMMKDHAPKSFPPPGTVSQPTADHPTRA